MDTQTAKSVGTIFLAKVQALPEEIRLEVIIGGAADPKFVGNYLLIHPFEGDDA